MKTAYLHKDDIGGHGAHARCYKLSEPHRFGRREHEYVVISLHQPWTHVQARVQLVPSLPTGAFAEISVREYPGTFVLHSDPMLDTAHKEGCFEMSLGLLGYRLVDAPEPVPEPEPENLPEAVADGLDYDPNELP